MRLPSPKKSVEDGVLAQDSDSEERDSYPMQVLDTDGDTSLLRDHSGHDDDDDIGDTTIEQDLAQFDDTQDGDISYENSRTTTIVSVIVASMITFFNAVLFVQLVRGVALP